MTAPSRKRRHESGPERWQIERDRFLPARKRGEGPEETKICSAENVHKSVYSKQGVSDQKAAELYLRKIYSNNLGECSRKEPQACSRRRGAFARLAAETICKGKPMKATSSKGSTLIAVQTGHRRPGSSLQQDLSAGRSWAVIGVGCSSLFFFGQTLALHNIPKMSLTLLHIWHMQAQEVTLR